MEVASKMKVPKKGAYRPLYTRSRGNSFVSQAEEQEGEDMVP